LLAIFPLHRQRREVERCAEILESHHGENANRIWRAQMAVIAQGLREQGANNAEVSLQLREFNEAVQHELRRRWLATIQVVL
jgi:hypothetical protein